MTEADINQCIADLQQQHTDGLITRREMAVRVAELKAKLAHMRNVAQALN